MTFDDFKEGFVAVLSQAIEQLSSSEDEDPSDSTAGIQHKKYAMQEKNIWAQLQLHVVCWHSTPTIQNFMILNCSDVT